VVGTKRAVPTVASDVALSVIAAIAHHTIGKVLGFILSFLLRR
jgi:hypothetical protein